MTPPKILKLSLAILLAFSLCLGPTNAETNMCDTNPPPKYSGSCYWAPWLWYCKGKELASWKVYQEMTSMAATTENIKFYANVLFLPFDDIPGSYYDHDDVLSIIGGYNVDLECVKNGLLNAYCSVVYMKSAETWISKIPSMQPNFSAISSATTRSALQLIFKKIPSIPTTLYKAFAAIRAMPEIANGLYYNVLTC
jgi:hypothetical protein